MFDFLLRYKKILILVGFFSIAIIVGFIIYRVFFKPAIVTTPTPIDETSAPATPGGFPSAITGPGQVDTGSVPGEIPDSGTNLPQPQASDVAQGGITETTALNDAPSVGATISNNGQDIQYYDESSGQFFRLDKDGNATLMGNKKFHKVENVTWSPNKAQAILEYPDGANILYDFNKDSQVTLPQHWKEFDFSPTGDKIILKSIGLDPNNRFLAISNTDGSKVKAVEPLGTKDKTVYPSWSGNSQIVAMYTEGIDFDRQEVFFVGQNNENFLSTVVEGRGFQPNWSPSGDQLLYSVYSSKNEMKPSLWVVNSHGESIGTGRKNLNIETWANKCTYQSKSELFCAVPENLEPGAGLFPQLAKNSIDRLYKIDPNTGLKKLIAIPNGNYSMENLIVSENGYYLYFTDANSKRLHKIKLK